MPVIRWKENASNFSCKFVILKFANWRHIQKLKRIFYMALSYYLNGYIFLVPKDQKKNYFFWGEGTFLKKNLNIISIIPKNLMSRVKSSPHPGPQPPFRRLLNVLTSTISIMGLKVMFWSLCYSFTARTDRERLYNQIFHKALLY